VGVGGPSIPPRGYASAGLRGGLYSVGNSSSP
jgi:hypothetical protein